MNILRKMAQFFLGNANLRDPRLYRALGGGENWSGKTVSADSALNLSAAYRCIRLISESIAVLPCKVYTRRRNGEVQVDYDHPLYMLLHDSPNRYQTAFEFWEGVGQALCMYGNFYAVKETQLGRIVALTPVRPDAAALYRKDGEVRYKLLIDGKTEDLPAEKVFHVRGWGGAWSLVGASPIQLGRQGLGLSMAVEEAASKFFANGLRPSGFIKVNQILKPDLKAQFRENMREYTGSGNTGKILLLEGGMEYQQLSLPPEDAQMLETRSFNTEEICRWFGVPPFLAFHTERSTSWGTGLEQQQLGYLIFSLMPYLERIEQACNKWLMSPAERLVSHVEFSVEGILRADSKARAEFNKSMVLSGLFTPDEVRATEGKPAIGGPAGKLWMPVNMQLIDADRTAPGKPASTNPAPEMEPAE